MINQELLTHNKQLSSIETQSKRKTLNIIMIKNSYMSALYLLCR